jgi:hypothetical protein
VNPALPDTQQNPGTLNEKLNLPMVADYDAHKLETVLNHWREVTGLNIQVDWIGLTNIGIGPDMPITLKIKNMPAGIVLEIILEQASTSNELDPIMYQVNQGLIQIATKRHFLQRPKVVVYDLTELLKKNTSKPILKTDEAKATKSESGDSRTTVSAWAPNGCSQDQNNGFGVPYVETKLSELQTLIHKQIEPKAWIEDGGKFTSISHFNDKLVVRAPQFMQQQIIELLRFLPIPPSMNSMPPMHDDSSQGAE